MATGLFFCMVRGIEHQAFKEKILQRSPPLKELSGGQIQKNDRKGIYVENQTVVLQ